MTPGARVAAAIGVLDVILAGEAAEKALTGWARGARYAGSKDRAAVRDHVFQALRCKRSYACLGGAMTGRGLMLGALRDAGESVLPLFSGDGHAPAPLSVDEATGGRAPETDGERLDLPDWLLPLFRDSLGKRAEAAALALRGRAPLMLRVNVRRATRDEAIALLAEDGLAADPVSIAPMALRLDEGARGVANSRAFREGVVELQDGSSQAAMAALDLTGAGRVLDYCAGGGGKVLALAARADAAFFAHDAAPRRMADLPARAARAGVRVQLLENAREAAPYDLVLCDAPCSGSGTWRRNPDAKWRLSAERLAELGRTQGDILDQAQAMVASHGRLAYATCSVFHAENEAQSDHFMARHPGWREILRRRWPIGAQGDGFYLWVAERR
ncbi:MAG: RsmB/NOP family class I SAM-dependent RNA methyltransferase [Pseudomonadota bacterium]|uniref:RsmB/NOP family class I SAM-dependent RNA methyltransferase n=1 Tax=Roseovarius sp. TaxID=1486281 RepID=UPI0035629622